MQFHFCHCCMPLPGDRIIGYVTRGRGVSIHKASCTNAQALLRDAERIVDVEWVNTASTQFLATICVKAHDRDSLLLDVSKALISLNISLKQLNTQTLPDRGGDLSSTDRFILPLSSSNMRRFVHFLTI